MAKHVYSPADLNLDFEDLYFPSQDGTRLHGWWLPARGKAVGSVLFLHGNAENISTHVGSVMYLPEQGLNVLLLDYRGYGYSEGNAYLEGLVMDVESAIDQLIVNDHTGNLAVFGQSLGAALAISVVANSDSRGKIKVLVADSSFTGFRDIAREKLSDHSLTWLFQWPLALTVTDKFRPVDEIGELSPMAVILVHGKSDVVIPFHHSESLYNAAGEPRHLWAIENAGHIEFFSRPENQKALAEELKSYFSLAASL